MESLSDMFAQAQASFPKLPEGFVASKAKPVGKLMLFAMQVAEPIQIVYLGGSNLNWVRFMAETHHKFGHYHIRFEGNPEASMTVMSDEEFRKKAGR